MIVRNKRLKGYTDKVVGPSLIELNKDSSPWKDYSLVDEIHKSDSRPVGVPLRISIKNIQPRVSTSCIIIIINLIIIKNPFQLISKLKFKYLWSVHDIPNY